MLQADQFSSPPGTNSLVNYLNFPEPPRFQRGVESGGIPKRLSDAVGASTEAVNPISIPNPFSEIVNDQAIFASLDDFIQGLTSGFSNQLGPGYSSRIDAVLNCNAERLGTQEDSNDRNCR